MSDKIYDEVFMTMFSVFSSGKKRISLEFSPLERSLSFEGLLYLRDVFLLEDCYLSGFYPFEG